VLNPKSHSSPLPLYLFSCFFYYHHSDFFCTSKDNNLLDYRLKVVKVVQVPFSSGAEGVSLVTSLARNEDKADCVAGADWVVVCEAGMWEELFIVDELPACRRLCAMERQNSKCSTVYMVFAGRSWSIMRLLTIAVTRIQLKCGYKLCLNMNCVSK